MSPLLLLLIFLGTLPAPVPDYIVVVVVVVVVLVVFVRSGSKSLSARSVNLFTGEPEGEERSAKRAVDSSVIATLLTTTC